MHVRDMREITVQQLDKYIIIDTHGGPEDILGIVAALKLAERFDRTVLGITCVNGRRALDQAVHDALVAQQIAGTSIPVFRGSKQSLLLKTQYPECYNLPDHSHQLDSIPVTAQSQALVQKQSAPIFIANQIRKYSDELCIITFGPLTNLALAFHRSEDIKALSSIRINGGSFTGVGNVINSTGSEGNLFYDPQAAHIVLTNYSNIYINPIEKVLQTSWESFFKQLLQTKQIEQYPRLKGILGINIKNKYVLCGPLMTIMPAFQRNTVKKVLNVYSEVINNGQNIVGLLAPNWLRLEVNENQQIPNTKIYSVFDFPEIHKTIKLALFG